MSSLIENAKIAFPAKAKVRRCGRRGCVLTMEKLPAQRLLIHVDKLADIPQGDSQCDYIFFFVDSEGDKIALIELKKGPLEERIHKQLQDTARYIEGKRDLINEAITLKPVAACGKRGRKHRRIYDWLRANRVKFCGEKYRIEMTECGKSLADAIK